MTRYVPYSNRMEPPESVSRTPDPGRYVPFSKRLEPSESDPVNHPAYYGGADNPYETIKVIESLGFGYAFCIGYALKYIMRAGRKTADPTEDLDKAIWCLNRAKANWDSGEGT